MSVPAVQKARIGAYMLRQVLVGQKRFPLVLMLEPLFRCNLQCPGCGKVQLPADVLSRQMSPAECLAAAEECGAPVVSIAGGEPLLYEEIGTLASELAHRRRFVYLCTNALLVEERLEEFRPSPYLTFNIHLDGWGRRHDCLVDREGTFNRAVAAIRLLLSRGFRVTTNTTLFAGETSESAARLFGALHDLGIEGMTVSAGFGYENAPEQGGFLSRRESREIFRHLIAEGRRKRWRFNHTSLYLSFLTGAVELSCTPWGTPTRNIFGWQKPCYLLDDGYAGSYREWLEETDWDKFSAGSDPRCRDCMVHCGFEPTAVRQIFSHPLKSLWGAALGRPGSFLKTEP